MDTIFLKIAVTIILVFNCCLTFGSKGIEDRKISHLKIYYIDNTDLPIPHDAEPKQLKQVSGTVIETFSSAQDIFNLINRVEFSDSGITTPPNQGETTINTILVFFGKDNESTPFYEISTFYGTYDKIYTEDFTKYILYSDYSFKTIQALRLIFPSLCYSVPLKNGERKIVTLINYSCYGLAEELLEN